MSAKGIKDMVKFRGGVMMWDCMTIQGIGMMYRIEGRMDWHLYKDILECKLIHTLHVYDLSFKKCDLSIW